MVSIIWTTGLFLNAAAEPQLSTKTSAPATSSTTTTAATMTATSPERPITLFVDRFGTIYWNREPVKLEAVVSALNQQRLPRDSIMLLYDPISLEIDRQKLFQTLRAAYPEAPIVFRSADGEEYAQWLFPANRPEVLEQMLSEQDLSDGQLRYRPEAFIAQLESYLTDVAARLNQIRSQVESFGQKYQQLSTQRSDDEKQ